MKTIPIYSPDSAPYFMEVPESDLANALNSVGWKQCPDKPLHDDATQHAPVWSREKSDWIITDKTPEEIAAETAATARKVWPSGSDFLQAFTMPEIAAISLSQHPTVAALRLLLATWIGEVWSDDPRVQAGLAALQEASIVTPERAAELVAK